MQVLEQNNFVLIIHICQVDLSALVIIILPLIFVVFIQFIIFLLLILDWNSVLLQLHGHLLLNVIFIFFLDVLATAEDLLLLLAF